MSRFANLVDKPKAQPESPTTFVDQQSDTAPSRRGRKAISGYFTPEMSLAMHTCARKHDMSLQALMAEAFNDILRKYGESPIGD